MSKPRSFFKCIIFSVVLLIPFIYSFFYLKAYWDPYGSMNKIPVAVVNEDEGEKGTEVINKLLDQNVLDFEKTDSETAQDGLKNQKYYATITLPKDFTKNLESASAADKTPARIEYSPNQKSNYLASQIINRVVLGVEDSVRSEVAGTIVSTLADKLKTVPEKLSQIEDGTTLLQSGANRLSDGLYTLDTKYSLFDNGLGTVYNGSVKLNNGLIALNSGLNTLKTGAANLNSGVAQINSALENVDLSKLDELKNGVAQLDNGTNTLSTNLTSYVSGVEQLAEGIKTASDTIATEATEISGYISNAKNTIVEEISNLPISETIKFQLLNSLNEKYSQAESVISEKLAPYLVALNRLIDGANQLLDTSIYGITPGQALVSGSSQLANGTAQLKAGISNLDTLTTKLDELKNGLAKIEQGTSSLLSGAEQLADGSTSAVSGSHSLTNGLGELKTNSTTIKDGISTLDTGASTLADGITTLRDSVVAGSESAKAELEKLEGLTNFASNPIKTKETDLGKIDQYGVSFTPLFISIGLWVGALMTYVVLFYDQNHRFGLLDSKNRSLKQASAYLGISVGLGLLTAFLLKLCIGFSVVNTFGYYASSALIAITFMSIIQCLITLFGDAGKFFALIILVLQLAASGGTFPIETVDSALSWLNPFLPMTYAIRLIKENVVSSDDLSGANIIALLVFLAISLALTLGYYVFFHKKSQK